MAAQEGQLLVIKKNSKESIMVVIYYQYLGPVSLCRRETTSEECFVPTDMLT